MDVKLAETLARLGLKLPPKPEPVGVYRPVVLSGAFAYLSGQLSRDAQGRVVTGKVGKDLSVEEGKRAAEWAALQAVSVIEGEIGLSRVEKILRMVGFVQSDADFYAQSDVLNAASALLGEIFGERGQHARTAVGVAALPLNAAVELELTLKVRDTL